MTIPSRSRIVDPESFSILPVGKGGVVQKGKDVALPLDGLVIQSVIAKWMGTLDEWAPHLDIMRERGYNMIHYTPLQQRGESNSPYSIYEQLEFSDDLFEKTAQGNQTLKTKHMSHMLSKIRQEWGMLGMIDVVLNHTAHNSKWLQEHPEAGYSVASSPHLAGALELDNAFLHLSGSLASLGLPTALRSTDDLDKIMQHIEHELLPALKLYEFYVLDVATHKKEFERAWLNKAGSNKSNGSSTPLASESIEERARAFASECLPDDWSCLGKRFHATPDYAKAVAFISSLLGDDADSSSAVEAFAKLEDVLNVERYQEFNQDQKAILDNTSGRIKYTRLEEHGPKKGEITEQ